MSQINVNVVAPLGYTGPDLPGDSNFVQVVDATGDTVFKLFGTNNAAIGKDALNSNTTGQRNIAIGTSALSLNTTNSSNVAIGHQAMKDSVGKTQSVAIGVDALKTGGSGNVAIGYQALFNGTGSSNVAVGKDALVLSTIAVSNTAIGSEAGKSLTDGSANVLLGYNSGSALTTGGSNVFIGNFAASFNSGDIFTGSNNIAIGNLSDPSSLTVDNEITLGNSSHTVIRAAVTTITSLSDARDKKDVKELGAGLDFVKGLKPVEFVWDDRDESGKHDVKDFGFIAQDLKKSQEDAELAETLKLVYEENPEKLEASYGKLVPILVKAIQELTAKVEALEAK
jgi:hypothetical protein